MKTENISQFVHRVRIIDTPYFDRQFADRMLGSKWFAKKYVGEKTFTEIAIVPVQGSDLLVRRYFCERNDAEKEIQRVTLGALSSTDLLITDFMLGVHISASYFPLHTESPLIKMAYEKIDAKHNRIENIKSSIWEILP